MLDIFLSPKSPFYKSATVFDVGTIDDEALVTDGLIYLLEGEYRFISPFFCDWIRRARK